jgi:hypothetical protein
VTGGTIRYAAQFRRAGATFGFAPLALLWTNTAGQRQLISRTVGGIVPVIDNDAYTVTWADAFGPGLDYRINCVPDEMFKTIIIRTKAALPAPTIGLAGLQLTLVLATTWNAVTSQHAGVQACAGGDLQYSDDISGTPDAVTNDPGLTEMRRGDGRAAFWLRKPRAWDSSEEPKDVALSHRVARWGTRTVTILRCPATALNTAGVVYPVYMDSTAIGEEQTAASTDDGHTYGTTWPGTTTTALAGTTSAFGVQQTTGFYATGARFATVPIPANATIDSSSISVRYPYGTQTNDTHVHIHADAHDDGATFADTTNTTTGKPGLRTRTDEYADWNIGTTSWASANWYSSSDISSPVQAVVSRDGWAENNAIVLLIVNFDTNIPGSGYKNRLAGNWDLTGNVTGPKFNASYTEAAAGGGIAYGVIGSPIVTGIVTQSRILRGDGYRA